MADFGIKIAKQGFDVLTVPSLTNKKNFTILSTESCLKLLAQGVISTGTNIAHGLGFTPLWDAYVLTDSSTKGRPAMDYWSSTWQVQADATYLYCTRSSGSDPLFYVIYLNEP